MATTAATLIQRTRRRLRDWPEQDLTTASIASNGATLTIADGTRYGQNFLLELEQEVLRCTANGSGTTVAVQRGLRGSTAASHASASTVLMSPSFFSIEILDALNEGLDACFPLIYRPVSDTTSVVPNGTTYEFSVPTMSGIAVAIPYLDSIEVKESGDTAYRTETAWRVVRDAAAYIKFRRPPSSGSTVRVHGYGPFTHLATIASTLDTYFPVAGEYLLDLYASSVLLASGEAARVRSDVGLLDQREQANRPGSSMNASDKLLNRFYKRLNDVAMNPMPPHVVSVF